MDRQKEIERLAEEERKRRKRAAANRAIYGTTDEPGWNPFGRSSIDFGGSSSGPIDTGSDYSGGGGDFGGGGSSGDW